MHTLDLQTLPKEEAQGLLLNICPRIGKDAPELAKLCGYLPLALHVSASFLAARPTRIVAEYVQQLMDERTRLKQLREPRDTELDVEVSLQLSYAVLSPTAKSALCQLSIFVTSFDHYAVRNDVEVALGSVFDDILDELSMLNLLEWDTQTERYRLHDLVRVFAAAQLAPADQMPLAYRHAQHYVQVAASALRLYLNAQALDGLVLFDQERAHIDAGWAWMRIHAGDP